LRVPHAIEITPGDAQRRARPLGLVAVGLLLVAGVGFAAFRLRPRPSPDEVWNRAEEDFRSGRWDKADAGLKQLAKLRAPTELDRLLRAQLAMAHEQADTALADLNSIPDSHAMAGQARMLAGQLELRRGRLRPAESYLRRALAVDPKLVPARKELIYVCGMQMRRGDLAEQFRALAEVTPLDYDQVLLWCLTRGSIWDTERHSEDLSRFLEADPSDLRTSLALAELYVEGGRTQKAEALLARLPADDPEARAARARLAFDRGQTELARKLLAEGPADDPGLARLRGRLALIVGDPQEALRAFQIAAAADPRHRDTLFGLGHAYRMLGDEKRAEGYLKSAADIDRLTTLLKRAQTTEGHADLTLPLKLAAACEKIGRVREAQAWCKVAIARDPFDENAQRVFFRLEKELASASAKG
jgi:tetratricopeptide (TPR) repeat protein